MKKPDIREVNIFILQGIELISKSIENKATLELDNFANGIYYIVLIAKTGKQTSQKKIIQK